MEVFFSYARLDKRFQIELVKHLTPLQQQGLITTWHDGEIIAGEEWKKEIHSHLESANIILLLISADFLASKYCYDIELKHALERHKRQKARVIPIILRPVDWHHTPFGKLAALPTNGEAITLWPDQDAAFADVAAGLRRAVKELRPVSNYPTTPKPATNDSSRRKFLQLLGLGLGGTGAFGAALLTQLFKPQPPNPVKSPTLFNAPNSLSKISFTSVRLGSSGQILERPVGSTMAFVEELAKGVSMTMVKIPAGKFTMGSPASEEGRNKDETEHGVTVPEFYFGQTLVNQAQWQSIMGNNPSKFNGDDQLPVDSVSWLDAMDFCQKLSQKTGRAYRLPSEAEWEYACRAGTKTPFAFGKTITSAMVNYNGNTSYASAANGEYRQKTTSAGIFPANGFGLYDMHGNLWEWCLDEWVNNYNNSPTDGSAREGVGLPANDIQRLLRGGSWLSLAKDCRSAYRNGLAGSIRLNTCGLRVVAS
jgi:formylglycine-generating enzyme required for sulfatase activity